MLIIFLRGFSFSTFLNYDIIIFKYSKKWDEELAQMAQAEVQRCQSSYACRDVGKFDAMHKIAN